MAQPAGHPSPETCCQLLESDKTSILELRRRPCNKEAVSMIKVGAYTGASQSDVIFKFLGLRNDLSHEEACVSLLKLCYKSSCAINESHTLAGLLLVERS